MPSDDRPLPAASHALLSAALGGLMSLAPGCSPPGDAPRADVGSVPIDTGTDATADDASAATSDAASVDAAMDDAATDDAAVDDAATDDAAMADAGDASAPMDTGAPDARDAYCEVDPARVVTATDASPGMTLEAFTAMCEGLGGIIEIHPHCGGMNSCRGLSYDSGTGVLTEHTCAGLNTCSGFSCVVG